MNTPGVEERAKMHYEPTIKDRVRIALGFAILDSKEENERVSTCILRFRSGLEAHQVASSNSSCYTLPDSKVQDTSKVYQAEIERMQNQISDLTKRLAEREADLSTVFADLEATTSKPPPKKRQKKATPTPLTNITNQPTTQPVQTDEPDKSGLEGGQEGLGSLMATVKKKVMAKGNVVGKGVDKDEHPVLVMCRKLDESLDTTIKTMMTMNTAGLLVKLFSAPWDIGQSFLPLRLQAILLHAKDLVQTISTYLTASIEVATNPKMGFIKKGLKSRIKYPKQVIQVLIGLSHVILTSTTTSVRGIIKELETIPEFNSARVHVEWTNLTILIGTSIIKPSIKAIDEITRNVATEYRKAGETRFGTSSNTINEIQNRDIRQILIKLLISLSRIDLDIQDGPQPSSGAMSKYPLSEIVAFGAMTAIVKLFEAGANTSTDKPSSLGPAHSVPEKGTIEALLVVIRSCIPYLPCLDSHPSFHNSSVSQHRHVASMLDAYKTGSGGSTDGIRGVSNLLLGMTLRTQLVHLLSPIVEPISNALLGFFSTPSEAPAPSSSALFQDSTIKESLLRLMEELMWAEGEEQGGMGDWLLEMIGQGGQQDQMEDIDGVEHMVQSAKGPGAEQHISELSKTIQDDFTTAHMHSSEDKTAEGEEPAQHGSTGAETHENYNNSLTNDPGSNHANGAPVTPEIPSVPEAELIDVSTAHAPGFRGPFDTSHGPQISQITEQIVINSDFSLLY